MGNPEQNNADATSTNNVDVDKVDYEKRFKDTQGAYTKSQQALKESQAKLEALEKLTVPKVEIDETTKAELDTLKYEDPDAWRARVNSLESEAAKKHRDTLNEAGRLAANQAEVERRSIVLDEFNRTHEIKITYDVIKYDVPPRITSKLEKGEISFDTYLEEVSQYLNLPKVVGDGNTTMNQPDLSKVGGDNAPSNIAVNKDITANYKDLVL